MEIPTIEQKEHNIFIRIGQKGILESLRLVFQIAVGSLLSSLRILYLQIMGYNISFGANISHSADFFQSTSHAISVGSGTRIRRNTRVNAGFKGTISIGKNVLIDDGSYIMAQEHLLIGDNTMIAPYCFIIDFDHSFGKRNIPMRLQGYSARSVTIGEDVWIGTHSVILKGVTIGKGAVIGAGSVVSKDVAPYTIVAGNPAKVIRQRK